ncbi:diguanylate cyclase [Pokkaliibacter sp. MBI-7]|uniref:diguanylate cyclase n=1 Tax=Pokkaliibacter sp. MBI-7 TaxID=3040600 RepID=UPI00244BD6FF|nr:diguanylate cyclase [Pokkaliibacter sp. MBI-7]MDH2431710.1 diguanylate cyclase [Pokkaliibacter sp. MBI-7]
MTRHSASHQEQQLQQLLDQAEQLRLSGNYRQGSMLAGQAAEQAKTHNLPLLEAQARQLLAAQLIRLGQYQTAVTAFSQAITLWSHCHVEDRLAETLTQQAFAYMELGLYEEAMQGLAQSMEIARRLDDTYLLFWAQNRIGIVHEQLGNFDKSVAFLLRALSLSERLGAEERFCILNNLASTSATHARHLWNEHQQNSELFTDVVNQGLVHARRALQLAQEASHPYRQAISLANYAMLGVFNGDLAHARMLLDQSTALAAQHGYQALVHDAEVIQARAHLYSGDTPLAVAHFERLLPALIEHAERPVLLTIYHEISEAYETMQQPLKALEYYKHYHQLEREQRSVIANTRAQFMTDMTELSEIRLNAERAHLEAELERLRMQESEAEKQALLRTIDELARQANEDELTGLKNRRFASHHLRQRLQQLQSGPGTACLALLDLDWFKQINDQHGHPVGDQVLRQVAQTISRQLNEQSLLARFGGEEFVLLTGLTMPAMQILCEQIRVSLGSQRFGSGREAIQVTLSIGVTELRQGDTPHSALERADKALYSAKASGRNQVASS